MVNNQTFLSWKIGYWLLFGDWDLVIGYLRTSSDLSLSLKDYTPQYFMTIINSL